MHRPNIQGTYTTGQVIQTLIIFWPPNDHSHSGYITQCTLPLSYTLFTDNNLSSAEQFQDKSRITQEKHLCKCTCRSLNNYDAM